MKQKKDRAIVFAVSNNLTFSIACVLMDIKRLSPDLADEVVILHDGISNKDKKLINTILPTRFIEYEMPFDDISFIPDSIINYFTKMVFAKFECLKLLNDYHSVLLSDYDIVVQKDISELFDYCESGIKFMLSGNVRDQLHYSIDEYDMDADGICASIFVLQDHIGDYNAMYDFCYKSLTKYANAIYLPEQSIINFMIQEFNLNVTPLKIDDYSPHPTDCILAPKAKVIHAYGQPKFWNGLENENWNNNYASWLKMGGSRYRKTSVLKRIVKKIKKIGTKYV